MEDALKITIGINVTTLYLWLLKILAMYFSGHGRPRGITRSPWSRFLKQEKSRLQQLEKENGTVSSQRSTMLNEQDSLPAKLFLVLNQFGMFVAHLKALNGAAVCRVLEHDLSVRHRR